MVCSDELSKLQDKGLSTIASHSFVGVGVVFGGQKTGYILLFSISVTSWITGPLFETLPGDEGYKKYNSSIFT